VAYVKTQGSQTVYPYSIGQLRRDNPNTSFPKAIPDATLAAYGVHSVTVLDAPEYDTATQKITQDANPTESNGAWELRWSIVSLTADELAAKAAAIETEARIKRDRLLVESDWTQVADAPVNKTAWASYRQALRNVPEQAGFPTNINWPSQPVE
jgi:hypothetical protein